MGLILKQLTKFLYGGDVSIHETSYVSLHFRPVLDSLSEIGQTALTGYIRLIIRQETRYYTFSLNSTALSRMPVGFRLMHSTHQELWQADLCVPIHQHEFWW